MPDGKKRNQLVLVVVCFPFFFVGRNISSKVSNSLIVKIVMYFIALDVFDWL